MSTPKQVDSYRFLDRLTKKLVQSWIGLETQRDLPRGDPVDAAVQAAGRKAPSR